MRSGPQIALLLKIRPAKAPRRSERDQAYRGTRGRTLAESEVRRMLAPYHATKFASIEA